MGKHYYGKYVDLFELSMKMLFVEKGYGEIPHLDAMGKRCFAFQNGYVRGGYYVPVADVETSVQMIAKYMGIGDRFKSWKPKSIEELGKYAEEGIVYGPIGNEIAIRRLKNIYYYGDNRYIYLKRDSSGKYILSDPDGFPALYYTGAELENLLYEECGVAVRLQKCENGYQNVFELERIWEDGWQFHRESVGRVEKLTQYLKAFEGYDGSSGARVALWTGVQNFLQHTEKIWNLKEEIKATVKKSGRLLGLQSDMIRAAEEGKAGLLPAIETAIWKELQDEI